MVCTDHSFRIFLLIYLICVNSIYFFLTLQSFFSTNDLSSKESHLLLETATINFPTTYTVDSLFFSLPVVLCQRRLTLSVPHWKPYDPPKSIFLGFYLILLVLRINFRISRIWNRREICSRKAQMISNWMTKTSTTIFAYYTEIFLR